MEHGGQKKNMATELKKLLKEIEPFCDRIIKGRTHYKAYVKGTNKVVTISGTSVNSNFARAVKGDFKRLGIIIK